MNNYETNGILLGISSSNFANLDVILIDILLMIFYSFFLNIIQNNE